MKIQLLTIVILLMSVSKLFAAGLGSTYAEFDAQWNKGYRQSFSFAGSAQKIHIGRNPQLYLSYITGIEGHCFGNPPRIGHIDGTGSSVFMDKTVSPTAGLFFDRVNKLLPPGSKLVGAYRSVQPYIVEKYVFKSSWLARLRGIKAATPYQSMFGFKGEPVGTFQLIITYDINDSARVANFTLALGKDDMEGMKRIKKNPFN